MKKEIVKANAATNDVMAAAPVSDQVQIHDVALVAVTAEFVPSDISSPGVISTDFRTEALLDSAKNILVVKVLFSLQAHHQDAPKVNFLSLDTTFRLVYTVDSGQDITQEQVDAFGQANAVFNAWPYWREYVQSTTVRMGLPPLVLPVFRIARPKADPTAATGRPDRTPTPKAKASPKL